MKTLLIIVLIGLTACVTYQPYIKVVPQTDVPKGSQEILCDANLEKFKEVLKSNNILFKTESDGSAIETEEFLIDEGTRAKIKATSFDGTLKIIPYWGITQKVKSQVTVYAGAAAAAAYDVNAWDRIIYNKDAKRPAMVFDYTAQLAKSMGVKIRYK